MPPAYAPECEALDPADADLARRLLVALEDVCRLAISERQAVEVAQRLQGVTVWE